MTTAIDLFSGAAGAWSLGLHRAGYHTLAACEADPWRRGAYAVNFPDVRLYDDITTLTADRLERDGVAAPWLVCGSPPCQDASTANAAGRGIDGERTGLFRHAVRLVRELRPRWLAFENVPGLANRGLDRVCDWLEKPGYRVWTLDIGAEDVGAPCIRRRLFIIGYDARAEKIPVWAGGQSRRPPSALPAGADQVDLRHEQGRVEPEWRASPIASATPRPDEGGQHVVAFHGRSLARSRRAARSGLGAPRTHWGHNYVATAGRHLRVATRLPTGLAGPIGDAYGDSIPPQIPEMIGRAMLEATL